MLLRVGNTENGKPVISGLFRLYETHGLPMDILFEVLDLQGVVPCWLSFYDEARSAGLKPERIFSTLNACLSDIYGPQTRDLVLGRLQRYSTYKEGGIMNTEFWTDILTSKNVDIQLDDLQKAGVIKAIFPEVEAMVGFGGEDQGHKDLWDHTKKVVQQAKAVPEIRWAALFHDVGKVEAFSRENGKITFHQHEFVSARLFRQAMRRTRLLQGNLLDNVNTLIKNLALVEGYSSEWTDSAVRRLNKELGDSRDYTLLLARADVTSKHAHKRARIQQLMHELGERAEKIAKADAVVPPLPKGLGTALMDTFGLSPSKKLGDVREALEAAVLSGKLEAHKDIDYYIDYLKNHPADFGLPV